MLITFKQQSKTCTHTGERILRRLHSNTSYLFFCKNVFTQVRTMRIRLFEFNMAIDQHFDMSRTATTHIHTRIFGGVKKIEHPSSCKGAREYFWWRVLSVLFPMYKKHESRIYAL